MNTAELALQLCYGGIAGDNRGNRIVGEAKSQGCLREAKIFANPLLYGFYQSGPRFNI
jgi:hypothetical protein